MPNTIWWIRRDLRLNDNPALHAALKVGPRVVPLFILDEKLLAKYKNAWRRIAFILAGLRTLDEDLRRLGSYLVVRRGDPVQLLPQIAAEVEAQAVFAQEDTHPEARERDRLVGEAVPLHLTGGTLIKPAGWVLKDNGEPYVVYSPFKRTWLAQMAPSAAELLPVPERIETPAGISSEALPDEPSQPADSIFPAGEHEARRRLDCFVDEGMGQYQKTRDYMAADGTSQLSPYFRTGMLSAREAAVRAQQLIDSAHDAQEKEGARTFLNELIWRDFYNHIEFHFPHVHDGNFNRDYDRLDWRDDRSGFEAWCQGRTGYPIVDAAMRQMLKIGWMHNRARMIVASFLVKDLLIDWRRGQQYFMEMLIDGDPAANNGSWQWVAGTGTDAAPYFRIFNPITQSEKFDPQGEYIRRWIPELATVHDKYIHAPWKMPPLEQMAAGIKIGQDYPAPIVDHKEARKRTLVAYQRAREESSKQG